MQISAAEKLDNLTRLYHDLHGMDGRGDLRNTGLRDYSEAGVGQRGFCSRGVPIYAFQGTTTEVAVRRVLEQHPAAYYGWAYRLFGLKPASERDPAAIMGLHYGLTGPEVATLAEIDRDRQQSWEEWCRRVMQLFSLRIAALHEEVHGRHEAPAIDLTRDEADAPARTDWQWGNLRILQGMLAEHGQHEPVFHYHHHNACSAMRVAYQLAALLEPDLYEDWWTHSSVRMAIRRDFYGLTNREYLLIQERDAHWRYDCTKASDCIAEILDDRHRPLHAAPDLAPEAGVETGRTSQGAATQRLPQEVLIPVIPSEDAAAPAERETAGSV